MIAVDTNALIYAHRAETTRHDAAIGRLRQLAEGSTAWALPVFCIAEFVRVVTHLRVFSPPSDLRTALDFIDGLLASPTVRLLLPGPGYAEAFRHVCESADVRGNIAFDAQIVAVCLEQGVDTLISADRGLARFPDIVVELL